MAVESARICDACGRESPSWASRCPVCGSLSLVHRVIIVPTVPTAKISGSPAGRSKRRRARMVGREPPRTSPARTTA